MVSVNVVPKSRPRVTVYAVDTVHDSYPHPLAPRNEFLEYYTDGLADTAQNGSIIEIFRYLDNLIYSYHADKECEFAGFSYFDENGNIVYNSRMRGV